MRPVSLAHLTVLNLPPPAAIDLAARAGFDGIGLRLLKVTPETPGYDLVGDKALMRATKERAAATGIRITDIEFVKITPDLDVPALEPMLAAGAELGARHLIVAPYDPDLGRMADRLGALCDLAQPYGLTVDLEFFPWTVVPSLPAALDLVGRTGRQNVGVLVDTLHFDRSDSALADLDRTPPDWLHFAHVCDAAGDKPTTHEGLIFTAREDRLPPGEGTIDLVTILSRLPPDLPVAVEVPRGSGLGPDEYEDLARRCRAGAARVLDAVAERRAGARRSRG